MSATCSGWAGTGLSQAAREDDWQCEQAQDNVCGQQPLNQHLLCSWSPCLLPCSGISSAEPWHTVQPHPPDLCSSSGLCSKHCSGCLLMGSAPIEALLLSSVPHTQLSQTLLTSPTAQGPSFAQTIDSECHTFQVFISSRTVVMCSILQSSSVTLNPPSPYCPYSALPQPFLTIFSYTFL